ncbi:MAG: GNAT family N-acetyltransferase [Pseudomonadota bacterium]|nr:GNAT family N-acetyltransferase [Pseudomonadota bacterium]
MTLLLRLATAADVPPMHAIRLAVRENRLSDANTIGEHSYLPYVEQGAAWVATTQGRIAGFAALDLRQATVWALFVDPDCEGLGVGRALHERLIAAAASKGLTRLQLTTSPGTRAEHFYRRSGWMPVEIAEAGEIRFELNLPGTRG